GSASASLKRGYDLVIRSMEEGIAAAVAGATMADVCRAIDSVLGAKGYGEYCRPPHIRRRGHGLGFGSNLPGDVSLDNAITLEADMFFVIHPNQYLPETGYLLCGEPVLVTRNGAEPLTAQKAALATIEGSGPTDRVDRPSHLADRPKRLAGRTDAEGGVSRADRGALARLP